MKVRCKRTPGHELALDCGVEGLTEGQTKDAPDEHADRLIGLGIVEPVGKPARKRTVRGVAASPNIEKPKEEGNDDG